MPSLLYRLAHTTASTNVVCLHCCSASNALTWLLRALIVPVLDRAAAYASPRRPFTFPAMGTPCNCSKGWSLRPAFLRALGGLGKCLIFHYRERWGWHMPQVPCPTAIADLACLTRMCRPDPAARHAVWHRPHRGLHRRSGGYCEGGRRGLGRYDTREGEQEGVGQGRSKKGRGGQEDQNALTALQYKNYVVDRVMGRSGNVRARAAASACF